MPNEPLEWSGHPRFRFDSTSILPATQGQRWEDMEHASLDLEIIDPFASSSAQMSKQLSLGPLSSTLNLSMLLKGA